MSHSYYDANRNRDNYQKTGYEGYHHIHGGAEPGQGGWRRGSTIVDYSAEMKNYVERTEKIVKYGAYPASLSPPRRDHLNKGHGAKGNPLLQPWGSALDRPNKGDKSPPRFNRKGLPWSNVHRDSSLPLRDHYRDYNYNSSSDDEDVNEDDVVCEDGVCVRKPKDKNKHKGSGQAPGNYTVTNHTTQPRKDDPYYDKSYTDDHNEPRGKGNGYNPRSYSVPVTTPRKDPHYNTSYPDNRNEKPKNSYSPPSYTVPGSTQPRRDPSYETSDPDNRKEKPTKGYSPPSYTVPGTTQPRRDPHYETSDPDNRKEKPTKGYNPPSYTVPGTTQPRKDPYYEASNNRPVRNNPLSLIKTKGDDLSTGSERDSPVSVGAQRSPFGSSPRKDQGYQETIDSTEARNRYGKVSPSKPQAEQKYTGIIDSKEAARRYNGVFVG